VNPRQRADGLPRPRKRFGQHFLVDAGVLGQIAELVQPSPRSLVLEVGPGRGELSRPLVGRLERLVGVEIDRDLAAHLREEMPGTGFRLIEGDFLSLDLRHLLSEEGKERLFAVGNIPYNITAPVLFHLVEHADIMERAVFTLQREVGRRLVAGPGSRDYGLITVLLRQHASARLCLNIDRRSFRPVPRVDSSVVEIDFGSPQASTPHPELFEQVARAAFSQRRKMLRNALKSLPAVQRAGTDALESRSGVDLSRRAETLTMAEFADLAHAAAELGDEGDAR
jgi:16S rRNA (adenine1518-N6/adenine1519-N6)-dimethyltransferase